MYRRLDPELLASIPDDGVRIQELGYKIMKYSCDDNQIVVDDKGGTHLKLDSVGH
jgi:hypothetical protein